MADRSVRELQFIPFGTLIGNPLKAAIDAQALSARTTVEFIESVGFEPDATAPSSGATVNIGAVRNVSFSYVKTDDNGVAKGYMLTAPLLSIVPIPYLRLDEVTVDFSANLTDMVEASETSKINSQANVSLKGGWWGGNYEFRGSVSASRERTTQTAMKSEYTMDIHVRAVQDDMPAGLAKVLSILEQCITEREAQAGGGG